MGVIAKDNRKITLYYHSDTSLGKQTHAYVKSSDRKILALDISKTKVTGTQWAEIAGNLDKDVSELIDKKHPDFVEMYGHESPEMDQHDWMKLLEKNPQILAFPIVIIGEKYVQIKNPSDFNKFLEAESGSEQKI